MIKRLKEVMILNKIFLMILLMMCLNHGTIYSQVISHNKEAILQNAKYVESLITEGDTVTIARIIKDADPLGIRSSRYSKTIVLNYSEMKLEKRYLDYDGLKSKGISNDGVNSLLHIVIPINKVGCGMFLVYHSISEGKIELWDIRLAYTKDEDVIPMPSFN